MAGNVGDYRIRWAVVTCMGGRFVRRERLCIAERRYSLLGLKFWTVSPCVRYAPSGDCVR